MVHFRSWVISLFPLILLLTNIEALRYRSLRHKRAGQCIDTNINACSFVTCENGGTCSQDLTTADCFTCQCTPGYAGKVCDTPIVIIPAGCSPGCQNGGVCDGNGNVCLCSAGYTGVFCETRDFCMPISPCQNGGQCTSIGANYVCDCTGTGYTGTDCTEVIPPIDPCASNPCENGGQCLWNGATMNCLCGNGYTGTFCQVAPVPCATTPCQNGGQCELLAINTYGCVCPAQFTGTQCETSILANHPCVTMPSSVCQNGGTCTVNGADYLCNCAAGWSGPNCQTRQTFSSCDPDPCGVHGTCFAISLPFGSTVYCNCEAQWTGKYCDVNTDVDCTAGYCLSGGLCRINGNVPYCQCPASYTGERCELLIDDSTTTIFPMTTLTPIITTPPIVDDVCLLNPCQNGGTCYSNSDTYRCDCPELWTGPLCDSPVTGPGDVCSPNPCYNEGICYPSGASFMCSCQAEFTGTLCETIETVTMPSVTTPDVLMACENQPCQNGGTCVPVGASYSCFCGLTSIYNGKNCDSTTPMTADECPLDCAPGRCIFSGNPSKPYACEWNGVMRPVDGTAS
jgi:hypothetical protein